jgi:two-component system response regulator HydG
VRELENVVKRLAVLASGSTICLEDVKKLAPVVFDAASPVTRARADLLPLREMEDEYITWVIQQCEGNKTRAAEILGIDVSTIHRREKGQTR